jgi:hypothetical protein
LTAIRGLLTFWFLQVHFARSNSLAAYKAKSMASIAAVSSLTKELFSLK